MNPQVLSQSHKFSLGELNYELAGGNLKVSNHQFTEMLKKNKIKYQSIYKVSINSKKDSVLIRNGTDQIYCDLINSILDTNFSLSSFLQNPKNNTKQPKESDSNDNDDCHSDGRKIKSFNPEKINKEKVNLEITEACKKQNLLKLPLNEENFDIENRSSSDSSRISNPPSIDNIMSSIPKSEIRSSIEINTVNYGSPNWRYDNKANNDDQKTSSNSPNVLFLSAPIQKEIKTETFQINYNGVYNYNQNPNMYYTGFTNMNYGGFDDMHNYIDENEAQKSNYYFQQRTNTDIQNLKIEYPSRVPLQISIESNLKSDSNDHLNIHNNLVGSGSCDNVSKLNEKSTNDFVSLEIKFGNTKNESNNDKIENEINKSDDSTSTEPEFVVSNTDSASIDANKISVQKVDIKKTNYIIFGSKQKLDRICSSVSALLGLSPNTELKKIVFSS